MLALIPTGFGNRRCDAFGNVHVLVTAEGLPVFRRPPRCYVGRHRRPDPEWLLQPLLAPLIWFRPGRM